MQEKKKVYILTFHSAVNYGAVIQCFALKKVIEGFGFDVRVINYRPRYLAKCYLGFRYKIHAYLKNIIQYVMFFLFTKKYLALTDTRYKTFNDFNRVPIDASYCICGSDQIWNTKISHGYDPVYFLDIPMLKADKIAYAISMGDSKIPGTLQKTVLNALKTFKAVSAREKFVCEELKQCGYEKYVPKVLDPSLLCKDYNEILPKNKRKMPYIAVYFVIRDRELVRSVLKLKEILKLPIINISLYFMKEADRNENFLNPGEWLNRIKNATVVCTSSFHGTALSVVFHKPFFTISLHGERAELNNRLIDFLMPLSLGKRLINHAEDIPEEAEKIINDIDFGQVEELLDDMRHTSISFLKKSLDIDDE